jgi:hypothetical protein
MSGCYLNEGKGWGMKQGWMGHEWDVTELFHCGSCGENFANKKARQKHVRRKYLTKGVSLRGEFINAIRIFSQCIFCGIKMGKKGKESVRLGE